MLNSGGSRAAATSKMECFVIIVNGWKLGCYSSPRSAPAEARSDVLVEDKFLIALPGKHKIIKFVSEFLSTMICFCLKT